MGDKINMRREDSLSWLKAARSGLISWMSVRAPDARVISVASKRAASPVNKTGEFALPALGFIGQ